MRARRDDDAEPVMDGETRADLRAPGKFQSRKARGRAVQKGEDRQEQLQPVARFRSPLAQAHGQDRPEGSRPYGPQQDKAAASAPEGANRITSQGRGCRPHFSPPSLRWPDTGHASNPGDIYNSRELIKCPRYYTYHGTRL